MFLCSAHHCIPECPLSLQTQPTLSSKQVSPFFVLPNPLAHRNMASELQISKILLLSLHSVPCGHLSFSSHMAWFWNSIFRVWWDWPWCNHLQSNPSVPGPGSPVPKAQIPMLWAIVRKLFLWRQERTFSHPSHITNDRPKLPFFPSLA